MHYLVGGPARSFITTQRDVDHQFENFQTVIAHATATGNDPLTTEQIDRIQKAVKAALEFYRGLLERNQIEENPSCAFGAGQMVGSITANAMTKAAETGGVIGAAAGYLSNHLWIVWLGGGAAVACLAIDFGILAYTAGQARAKEQKSQAILATQQIAKAQQKALLVHDCVQKFSNCRAGNLQPLTYQREVASCLKKYRLLQKDAHLTDLYARLVSLFVQNLSHDHPIFAELKKLKQTNPPQQVAFLPPFMPEIEELAKAEEEEPVESFSFSSQDENEELLSSSSYHSQLLKCHQIIKETFGLNPKKSLKFLEVVDHNQRTYYTRQGAICTH